MFDVATLAVNVDTTDLKDGSANLNMFTAAGKKAEAQANKVSTSASRMGSSAKVGAGGFRNLGMQLNQVAQVGGMTGNWMNAIAVQLPDMLLGFGSFGIAAGIAAGAMIPLISSLTGTADASKQTQDNLDALTEAVNDYKSAADLAMASVDDLTERFGSQAVAVRETLDLLQNIALTKAMDSLNVSMLQLDTGRLEFLVDIIREGQGEIAAFDDNFNKALAELNDSFRLTADQAQEVMNAMTALGAARGPEQISIAARDLNNLLLEVYGTVQDMPPEFREIAEAAARADVAASDMVGTMEAVSGSIANATAAMGEFTQATWDAVFANNALGNSGVEGGRGGDPREFSSVDEFRKQLSDQDAWKPPRRAGGGRKSGGGGGAPKVDPREREAARIYDETRTAAEKYAAELEDLNELRELGYLTEETHTRAVKMLGEEFNKAGDLAKEMGSTISDALADVILNFDNARDAAANLLDTLARLVLNSAFQSAGVSDFLGGLFSFDGGGYTGSGSRAGGIDGKGGFPAILHPQETVVDHTRGQGGGGGMVDVRVHVDQDGNWRAAVERISGGVVQQGLQSYDRQLAQSVRRVNRDPRKVS